MENTKNVAGSTTGTVGNPEVWDSTADAAGMQTLGGVDGTSDTLQSTTEQTSSAANRTFDKFSDKATQAKDMLSEKFNQMKGQQGKWADDARGRVRESPMMAMGIAVAAGFLLRRLLSRSRR